jgi:hypothetical protein
MTNHTMLKKAIYLDSFERSMIAARVARQQGDRPYNDWMSLAGRAKSNYNRHCLS